MPGTFTFIRLPGRYFITTFVDANEDFVYQPTEYASYVAHSTIIAVKPGENISHLDLPLQHPLHLTLTEAPDLTSPATKAHLDLSKIRAGEITTLENERFSTKNGQRGLWEPIRFLQKVGGGVFFLESFDPEKIPVLFVHGVGGNPRQWTSLIHQIDRTRYQRWIFYYPSGLRLHMSAEFLVQSLSKVFVNHKIKKLAFPSVIIQPY